MRDRLAEWLVCAWALVALFWGARKLDRYEASLGDQEFDEVERG